MREAGDLIQLRAGMDEDLHFTAQELARLRGPEPGSDDPLRRPVIPDPGQEVARIQTMRAVLRQLRRRGQIGPDSWTCGVCYYSNPSKMRQCRGYLDVGYDKIGGDMAWVRNRKRRRDGHLRLSCA